MLKPVSYTHLAVTNNIALMSTFYDSDNTSGEVLNNDFTEEESFETALDVELSLIHISLHARPARAAYRAMQLPAPGVGAVRTV